MKFNILDCEEQAVMNNNVVLFNVFYDVCRRREIYKTISVYASRGTINSSQSSNATTATASQLIKFIGDRMR